MGKKKDQKTIERANEGFGAVTTSAPAPAASKRAKAAAPAAGARKAGSKISTEDIALRAYFISEKRRSQGGHGNEHLDWLEAERQLVAESKKAKKNSSAS